MPVLAIETSCDETAAAVVERDGRVRSDVVWSQLAVHAPYGGVVPELASRAHLTAIVPVVREAMSRAGVAFRDLDGVAVTNGPGLVGALLVGVQTAKAIAYAHELPIVGVSHLHGHLLAVFLRRGDDDPPPPPFPFVALLVSGGHTQLYRTDGDDRMSVLGATRDDAAGEAFDKVGKLVGLGYPGGPVIDRLAAQGNPRALRLPRANMGPDSLEFSFSGLKTAVAVHVRRHGVPEGPGLADLCASFQAAVVDVLVRKTLRAAHREAVRDVVLCGGVAANRALRAELRAACESNGFALHVPTIAGCTDNAAMIGYAGALRLARGERDGLDLNAHASLPEAHA